MRPLVLLFTFLFSVAAFAAPNFPALSGRVVDEAHVLSSGTATALDQMLADYERGTTNQVVIVILPSLQGYSIGDFGYQLGRHWGIGQKGKDNGALLIVAPKERQVRVEVGYGLEPILTDAASSVIINSIMLPTFKAGKIDKAVLDGTKAILSVLGGKGVALEEMPGEQVSGFEQFLLLAFFVLFIWMAIRNPLLAMILLSNSSSRFGSSRMGGGFNIGGGGFRGGGGSFGGGGASGRW